MILNTLSELISQLQLISTLLEPVHSWIALMSTLSQLIYPKRPQRQNAVAYLMKEWLLSILLGTGEMNTALHRGLRTLKNSVGLSQALPNIRDA